MKAFQTKFILFNIERNIIYYNFDTKGTSHCVDMYANAPGDPEELVAARKRIGELVDKWVKEA